VAPGRHRDDASTLTRLCHAAGLPTPAPKGAQKSERLGSNEFQYSRVLRGESLRRGSWANVRSPLRVVQWGTGNTGAKALEFVLTDPALELVALYVSRADNAGRDAGDLVGSAAKGVKATVNASEIVEAEADCVIYMAAEPNSNPAIEGTEAWQSVDMICQLLASGKNVISTGISGLINPRIFG
jgi:hypothetical protein